MVLLTCPQCGRRCKNLSGLKRHENSAHGEDPGLGVPVAELQRNYHPNLNGTYNASHFQSYILTSTGRRCNKDGMFIPIDEPPGPQPPKAENNWSPFTSRASFELADFLFTDAQLSQKKIDHIFELWAATLVPHGDSAPFTDHMDLHQQINAIDLGSVRWEHTCLKYEAPLPETTRHPEWMTTEYDVWYRNPRQVIKNILARPDLDGHIDYAAYKEFNDEKRQYGNMMSGDWAWRQSVRSTRLIFPPSN